MNFQPVWISPTGDVIMVLHHEPYAEKVLNFSGQDEKTLYMAMFRRGWIRGVIEGNWLYLNNTLDTAMTSLHSIPIAQCRKLKEYALENDLILVNTKHQMINEHIAKGQLSTPSLVSDTFKQKLASVYAYMAKELGIKKTPKLIVINSAQNAKNPFGYTAHYNHETKTVTLFITGRHETDQLRSFCHEIIHHWQNERGTLHVADGGKDHTPSHYAQNDLNLRKREMEAYLFGNMIFRDWQDFNRYGPPAIKPIMPQPYD